MPDAKMASIQVQGRPVQHRKNTKHSDLVQMYLLSELVPWPTKLKVTELF